MNLNERLALHRQDVILRARAVVAAMARGDKAEVETRLRDLERSVGLLDDMRRTPSDSQGAHS